MLYTVDYVRKKYNKYNNELFGGVLPPFDSLEFHITNKSNPWGRGGVTKMWISNNGEYHYEKGYLELSNYYDNTEEWKDNVLVHEMCHIYEYTYETKYLVESMIARKPTLDFPRHGHGTVFNELARKLKPYGFDITRFVSSEEQKSARLSDDNVTKFSKKINKEQIMLFIGKYNDDSKYEIKNKGEYSYFYRILKFNQASDFIREGIGNKITHIDFGNFYYNISPEIFAKYNAKKFSINRFFLTNDLSQFKEVMDSEDYYTLDEMKSMMQLNKQKSEEERNRLAPIILQNINYISKEIIKKLELVNISNDDWKYEGTIKPTSFMIKLNNNDKLKISIKKPNHCGNVFKDGIIYIDDDSNTSDWYGLSEALDLYNASDSPEIYYEELNDTIQKKLKSIFVQHIDTTSKRNKENVIAHFRMPIMNGGVFEFRNITKDELKKKIKERFPKWNDETIDKQINNPKFLPKTESVIKNKMFMLENIINEVIEEFVNDEFGTIEKEEEANFPPSILEN